jgi:hypothetical protein
MASSLCLAFSLPITAQADTPTADSKTAPAAAAKIDPNAQYQFFTGLNLTATNDNSECPVVDFRNRSAILWTKGKTVGLHMSQLKQLHFYSASKLSRDVVIVTNYKTKAVAKPGTSESENMLRIMSVQNMADDSRQAAIGTSSCAGGDRGIAPTSQSDANKETTHPDSSGALKALSSDYGPGQHMSAGLDAAASVKDTLDISFTVSAKEPIENVYAFVLALVKAPGTDNSVQQWVHFEQIDRIDSDPQNVHFTQPGLPPNFELVGTGVFIYAHGEEIANSMSNQLTGASADEARALINKDYVDSHKGMNLAPSLATVSIPDAAADTLQKEGVTSNLLLHLDADAKVTAAECDGKAVSPKALDILHTLVFHPGLKNGAPVAASVHINIFQFSTGSLVKMTHK